MNTPKLTTRYAYDTPLGRGATWDTLDEALEDEDGHEEGATLLRLYVNEAGRIVHTEEVVA